MKIRISFKVHHFWFTLRKQKSKLCGSPCTSLCMFRWYLTESVRWPSCELRNYFFWGTQACKCTLTLYRCGWTLRVGLWEPSPHQNLNKIGDCPLKASRFYTWVGHGNHLTRLHHVISQMTQENHAIIHQMGPTMSFCLCGHKQCHCDTLVS